MPARFSAWGPGSYEESPPARTESTVACHIFCLVLLLFTCQHAEIRIFCLKVVLIPDSQQIRRAGHTGVLCPPPSTITQGLRLCCLQQAICLQLGQAVLHGLRPCGFLSLELVSGV